MYASPAPDSTATTAAANPYPAVAVPYPGAPAPGQGVAVPVPVLDRGDIIREATQRAWQNTVCQRGTAWVFVGVGAGSELTGIILLSVIGDCTSVGYRIGQTCLALGIAGVIGGLSYGWGASTQRAELRRQANM